MSASAPSLFDIAPLFPRLEVVDADDRRCIFLNGHLAGRYPCDDKGTERVLVTQLAEVLSLPDRQIAAAFDLHPVTVSRFRGLVRQGGAAALLPLKSGPKGPSKTTPRLEARCRSLRADGLSFRVIAAQVSTRRKSISYVTVAALFRAESALPQQDPLPLETAVSPEAGTPPVEAASFGAGRSTRYAGAMMLFAALARLDLWSVFQDLGATTGPARRFGWAQTVAAIVFCFALRFRSIEDWKNGLRRDLGVLIGEPDAPSVLSMRTKVKALAESVDPVAFSRAMFGRYLALEPVWEGLYYVDGHFCPYYGQHPTPRGWDAKRRLAVKGHTGVYIHDARGRSLFFFSQPLNDSLARAIPAAVAGIRRAHGQEPFTLIFDRGGYSGDTFRFLQAEGIGFITYLKGRSARRRYASQRFRPGWFSFEGRRHSYKLFEKKTRLRGVGSIRTILFLGEDEQQIPVLTNLTSAGQGGQGRSLPALAMASGEQLQIPFGKLRHRPDHPIRSRSGDPGPPDPKSQAESPQGGGAHARPADPDSPGTTGPRAGRQRREQTPHRSWPEDRSCPPAARDRPETSSPRPSGKPSAPHARPDLRSQGGQDARTSPRGSPFDGQRLKTGRRQCREDARSSF